MNHTLDVHGVSRIAAETKVVGSGPSAFNVTRFRLYAVDGSETVITAFTDQRVLPIEGADHVNHVASSDQPMELA